MTTHTTTNCSQCGQEINAETSPQTPEGHMCSNCHVDYKLLTGAYNGCL